MATTHQPVVQSSRVGERAEHGYIALASLARRLPAARHTGELAAAVSQALAILEPVAVRLWGVTTDGVHEVARATADIDLPQIPSVELKRAAVASEAVEGPAGSILVGLHVDGMTLGVLEAHGAADRDTVELAAPLVACRLAVLAGQGVGEVQLLPIAVSDASDVHAVMGDFARQAKRLLDHDRLSVYLLTHQGLAFERFAVATSAIVPGEGVLIPFEDIGLRHTLLSNRSIVSSDLGADPRLAGPEDRVIARAGFRGLLSVPLRHDGRPFGILNFVSRKPGFYRSDDVPIAEQIADQIAVFVQNLRVQRRVQAFVRREASERERTRLARDLYQSFAEAITEIRDVAQTMERAASGESAASREDAVRICKVAHDGLTAMRRALVDLDPPGLEGGGLGAMLTQAVARFGEQTGCAASVEVSGDPSEVPSAIAQGAYRVLQEALMNARRHADARTVAVRLTVDRDLLLTIEDDGSGFDPRSAIHAEGLGLRHMHERADALGGFLAVRSEPGHGTAIRLKVPRVRAAAALDPIAPPDVAGAAPHEKVLRVFVADPELLLRAGICRLVDADDDMRVVGEAGSLEETKLLLRQLRPDAALVSTSLTASSPETLLADIRPASPSSAVLMVCHGEAVEGADLLAAGAAGVIGGDIEAQRLTEAIRAVASGNRVLSGSSKRPAQLTGGKPLTARERSILTLVARGDTNAEIGRSLYLATKTVERQVATIVHKLDARNRAHAAAIAVAQHVVDLPAQRQ